MTDTFRELCAELIDSVELLLEMRNSDRRMQVTEDRLTRARAALAKPEPVPVLSRKEFLLQKLDHIADVADKYQETQDAIADLCKNLEVLLND